VSESIDNKRRVTGCETEARLKKTYHKPTVRYERVFEVQALSCGKVQVTQSGCGHNRKTS
jgi:hypothetical protein